MRVRRGAATWRRIPEVLRVKPVYRPLSAVLAPGGVPKSLPPPSRKRGVFKTMLPPNGGSSNFGALPRPEHAPFSSSKDHRGRVQPERIAAIFSAVAKRESEGD